jgi:hypothetical protein
MALLLVAQYAGSGHATPIASGQVTQSFLRTASAPPFAASSLKDTANLKSLPLKMKMDAVAARVQ